VQRLEPDSTTVGDACAEQKVSPRSASGQSAGPGLAISSQHDVSSQRERRCDRYVAVYFDDRAPAVVQLHHLIPGCHVKRQVTLHELHIEIDGFTIFDRLRAASTNRTRYASMILRINVSGDTIPLIGHKTSRTAVSGETDARVIIVTEQPSHARVTTPLYHVQLV